MPRGPGQAARKTVKVDPKSLLPYDPGPRGFAALVIVQGSEADIGRHVVCDRPVTLGRDADVEMPLDDESISRRHCRVERDAGTDRYLLTDLGSTNGTRLNGAAVKKSVPLGEGDKVFVGETVLRFTYADRLDVEYQAKLEALVATDALTGMLTRRRFDRAFSVAVGRAISAGTPLGVLVMDLDGLKQINDTHGHEMGAYAIVEVARIVRDVMKGRGEICRFGGDEFVAFLPGLDKESARAVAEQMRGGVEAHRFERDGVRLGPTISLGVAALPDDARTSEDLFRAADRALYRAKSAGRNRVAT